MKPSYLVSRLLMPVFASMLALSLSANYSFADALVVDVDAGTITDNVTVESSADGDVAGVTIGDSTEVDEFSGAISVTDTTGSSGSYVRGLYITGNNKSGSEDTTSSLDLFSGTIEVSSVDGYARGIELEGSYTSSSNTYTGGNYLGEITADSTITVSSDTYSSWGIRNQFSTIGAINGTISSTSAGSASTSALYNDSGTVGTIAGTLESTQEGSGTTRTIWNAWNGHNPATIDSITGTITATGNTGTTTAIYNLGTIDYLNASVSATASTGSIFALYCDNYEYTSAYGTINTLSGSVTASSAGYSCAVYNQSIIGEIVDLTVKSTSSSGGASGIYSTYSKNDYISIGSISGTTVEVSAYTYAYGIWNLTSSSSYSGVDGTSSSIGDIEADVSVASQTSYAIGISNTGESIGSVSGTITVNGYSAAYGINNYADMGDVNADIKASATKASGEAVGIYLGASSSIGTIGGSITVTGDWSYGVYINNTNTLTFEDGASITSTNSYDDAYSIYSTASSLTLESAGTVTLTGDIEVDEGNGSLTITSGNFVLESEAGSLSTIAASSVTIGESASLSLTIYADDVFSSESFSLTNEGTLNLSAGIGLETGSIYAISNNTSLDFNDLGDVVAYGGTIDGNNFIIGKTEYIELDNSDSTGVQLTEDNSRIEVSSSSDSAASEEEVTTIVMNFSTTGIDDEDNDKVITVSAVSTVTNLENITLTIDNGGDSTVTTVNALDSTFAEFINETMDEDLTLAAAEAYYFAVDGLTVGDSVQLIFDVGEGFDTDLITVYYLSEGAESWDDAKEITDFTYEGQYLYVYAEGFSTYGYSIAKSATVVVPEPSTATLSLLALAGLLARRRRKA